MAERKIVIIGAGGHGKVILDIILKQKEEINNSIEVLGFLDDDKSKSSICGYPILGLIEDTTKVSQEHENVYFLNAIGNNKVREKVVNKLDKCNLRYYTAIHPKAVIGTDVNIGEGTVVMAGAIINSGTIIGKHVIINTGSIIEHDNTVEDYVHISPGAKCAGIVTIKRATHIGTGVNIIPNITIGEYSVVGAGATVIKEIPSHCTAVGIPAKPIKFLHEEE